MWPIVQVEQRNKTGKSGVRGLCFLFLATTGFAHVSVICAGWGDSRLLSYIRWRVIY